MGNTLSNGIIDSTNRSIMTNISEGNDNFKLANIVSDQLGIPTVNEVLDSAGQATRRVYNDVRSDITNTGSYIADTTKDVNDGISFTVTLVYVAVGGTLIIFGPQIFDGLAALAERIRTNGITAEIKI